MLNKFVGTPNCGERLVRWSTNLPSKGSWWMEKGSDRKFMEAQQRQRLSPAQAIKKLHTAEQAGGRRPRKHLCRRGCGSPNEQEVERELAVCPCSNET